MSSLDWPAIFKRPLESNQPTILWWGAGLLLFVVLALGAMLLAPSTSSSAADTSSVPILEVLTEPVKFEDSFSAVYQFVGEIEADRESNLGFERAGRVTRVAVDEGDAVQAGQVVAELDTEQLQSRREELVARREQAAAVLQEMEAGPRKEVIESARAEVEQWKAELSLARANKSRQERLRETNAASNQEWDEARFREQSVAASLASAAAKLAELEAGTRSEQIASQQAIIRQLDSEIHTLDVDIDKSKLKTPYQGTIAKRFIDEGEVVSAGQSVVHILETGRLQARIGVSRDLIRSLEPELTYSLIVGEDEIDAKLRSVSPDRSQRTRTVTALLDLVDPPVTIRCGDLARLDLEQTVAESGAWLPIRALSESHRGLWSCLVAFPLDEKTNDGATHEIERRQIEILYRRTNEAFVRGTIVKGERVITDGTHRIVEGQHVRLSDDKHVASLGQ